jgi:hypothetical protein
MKRKAQALTWQLQKKRIHGKKRTEEIMDGAQLARNDAAENATGEWRA